MTMGVITKHLIGLVAKQVEDHGLVSVAVPRLAQLFRPHAACLPAGIPTANRSGVGTGDPFPVGRSEGDRMVLTRTGQFPILLESSDSTRDTSLRFVLRRLEKVPMAGQVKRILLECTQICESRGTTGIPRVVRNLADSGPAAAREHGIELIPVLVRGRRFYPIQLQPAACDDEPGAIVAFQRKHRHPGYGRNLFMFNDLSDGELDYCYRHAKGFLFPSKAEGYGLPIVEALSYGLPVLSSDIPIHREVGKTCCSYFDLADAACLARQIDSLERFGVVPAAKAYRPVAWADGARDFVQQTLRAVADVKAEKPRRRTAA